MGGQGRRMGCSEDLRPGEEGPCRLGVISPEHGHEGLGGAQNRLGERFPASSTMRAGVPSPDREDPVQQQYTLVEPWGEIAGFRVTAKIVVELLEDVGKALRQRTDVCGNREGKPMGVAGRRIRILSDDDDTHVGQWQRERTEYVDLRRQRIWFTALEDVGDEFGMWCDDRQP